MRNRTPTTATRFCFMSMVLEAISEKRIYKKQIRLAGIEGIEPSPAVFLRTLLRKFLGDRNTKPLYYIPILLTNLAGQLGLEPRRTVLETVMLPITLLTLKFYTNKYWQEVKDFHLNLQPFGRSPYYYLYYPLILTFQLNMLLDSNQCEFYLGHL